MEFTTKEGTGGARLPGTLRWAVGGGAPDMLPFPVAVSPCGVCIECIVTAFSIGRVGFVPEALRV